MRHSALPADEVMPWEEWGVPLALIGTDAQFVPLYADRAAVVRRGGLARNLRVQPLADGARVIAPVTDRGDAIGLLELVLPGRPGPASIAEVAAAAHALAYVVIAADFVSMDTGSGLVHVAPAFGEDDFRAAKAQNLGFLQLVEPDGKFSAAVTDFAGRFCKDADRDIIRNLRHRGLLYSEEVYRHEYPFSWRRDTDPASLAPEDSCLVLWRDADEQVQVLTVEPLAAWLVEQLTSARAGTGPCPAALAGQLCALTPGLDMATAETACRRLLQGLLRSGLPLRTGT